VFLCELFLDWRENCDRNTLAQQKNC